MRSGQCVFQGTTTVSSRTYLRYELNDNARWDKNARNIAYLVPEIPTTGPVIVEKTNSMFDLEDLNAGFVFYSDSTKKDLARVIERMKNSKYPLYTSIILVWATKDGAGTRVSLLLKEGENWLESGPHLVDQPIQQNPWWVAGLPAGYFFTVPFDLLTFPVQAPFLIFSNLLGKAMSPK